MKKSKFFTIWWTVLCILFFVGCNLLDSAPPTKEPLIFENMEIQYTKFGGWIDTHKLFIKSSGEASAKVIAHASREVLEDTTTTLTEAQRELLSNSFSSFSWYERHYRPEKYMTDGNFHQIVLIYDGVSDTVSTYMPNEADLPKNLLKLIDNLEHLHQSILELDN